MKSALNVAVVIWLVRNAKTSVNTRLMSFCCWFAANVSKSEVTMQTLNKKETWLVSLHRTYRQGTNSVPKTKILFLDNRTENILMTSKLFLSSNHHVDFLLWSLTCTRLKSSVTNEWMNVCMNEKVKPRPISHMRCHAKFKEMVHWT